MVWVGVEVEMGVGKGVGVTVAVVLIAKVAVAVLGKVASRRWTWRCLQCSGRTGAGCYRHGGGLPQARQRS